MLEGVSTAAGQEAFLRQQFEELNGNSYRYLSGVLGQEVSEDAALIVDNFAAQASNNMLNKFASTTDEAADMLLASEKRQSSGFKHLVHAVGAMARKDGEESEVILGVAETMGAVLEREARPLESGIQTESEYENLPAKDAAYAAEAMYQILGVSRPIIFGNHVVVGTNLSNHKVGPVSQSGQLSTGEQSSNVRVLRDIETGAVESVETMTPFGITIVEKWGVLGADDTSDTGNPRVKEKLRLKTPAGVTIERDTTVHTIKFLRTPKFQDKIILDEMAHKGVWTPEAEALRSRIDSVVIQADAKSEELTESLNKLNDKADSRLPFRRPNEEKIRRSSEAQDSSVLAASIAKKLQVIATRMPERTKNGFKVEAMCGVNGRGMEGMRAQTMHTLSVFPSAEGILFSVTDESKYKTEAPDKTDYLLSDDGRLYELTDKGGKTELQGTTEELMLGRLSLSGGEDHDDSYFDIPGRSGTLERFVGDIAEHFDWNKPDLSINPYKDVKITAA